METIEAMIDDLAKQDAQEILGIWESDKKFPRKLRDTENIIAGSILAVRQPLYDFAIKVSRSACLNQVNGDKCICFACEAKRLLNELD